MTEWLGREETKTAAYGLLQLLPAAFGALTPGEFLDMVRARIRQQDADREFIAAMVAYLCQALGAEVTAADLWAPRVTQEE